MSERHQDTHALDAFMRQHSSGGQHDGDVHALVHRGFTVHNLRLRNPDATNAFAACHLPAPPANNEWSCASGSIYWLGPDEWLLVCPEAVSPPEPVSAEPSSEPMTVNDLTGGWVMMTLSGPGTRPLLERGCPMDLDPAAMGEGQCAQTLLAKSPVLLAAHADPNKITLLVRRSFAEYVALWLAHTGETFRISFAFEHGETDAP